MSAQAYFGSTSFSKNVWLQGGFANSTVGGLKMTQVLGGPAMSSATGVPWGILGGSC